MSPSRPARLTGTSIQWIERGLVPDALIRAGIRRLCDQRLAETGAGDAEAGSAATEQFAQSLHLAEIAPLPRLAFPRK